MTFYRFYMKLPHSERYFSTLARFKIFLRSTVGQDQLSSITAINIERKYATRQCHCQYFVILYLRNVDLDLPSENICTILIALALTAL